MSANESTCLQPITDSCVGYTVTIATPLYIYWQHASLYYFLWCNVLYIAGVYYFSVVTQVRDVICE